jgi:hypothetical protein
MTKKEMKINTEYIYMVVLIAFMMIILGVICYSEGYNNGFNSAAYHMGGSGFSNGGSNGIIINCQAAKNAGILGDCT